MQKARSRLHQPNPVVIEPTIVSQPTPQTLAAKPIQPRHSSRWRLYLSHLPTLGLAIIFSIILGYLLTHFYPQQLKNLILPGWYLPILLFFFLAIFFSSSFLLLNSRKGLIISSCGTTFLWLQLQQVQLNLTSILIILSCFLILGIGNELFRHRRS